MRKAWIVGASSGLGKALADELAGKGVSLILSARNLDDLSILAYHYRLTKQIGADTFALDLSDAAAEKQVTEFLERNLDIDAVFVCVGGAQDLDRVPFSRTTLDQVFQQNCLGPAMVLSESVRLLNPKHCVVVSSISARIPRVDNACYSAAKSALEDLVKSMNLYLYRQQKGYEIKVIRLGYMKSRWTAGKTLLFPAVEPVEAAKTLLFHLDQNGRIHYVPGFWFWIHSVLRWMPWFLYRKLKF